MWDKVNGETMASGTSAAAAVAAAIKIGKCARGKVITVKLRGGDLFVKMALKTATSCSTAA